MNRMVRLAGVGAPGFLLLALQASPASALPSFSRQTGEECAACHVGGYGPQLTTHGRMFKLEGYGATSSWSGVQAKNDYKLAVMAVANYTHTAAAQSEAAPHFKTNDNFALQEVSLFLAGKLAPGLGAFIQGTYSGIERKASLDNMDIRVAKEIKLGGKDAVIGASINNNPTVQDVWNSTPAWGYPYTSPDLVPERAGSPLIAGGLGQQVLGATGYVWFDDRFYAEFGGYRSVSDNALKSLNLSQDVVVDGTAPYWRVAYSRDHAGRSASIGLFGLDAKLRPDPTESATDHFTDIGVDATYQIRLPKKASASVNAAYIHEKRRFDASYAAGAAESRAGNIDSFTLDGSYYWDRRYGATVGLFRTTGSVDEGLFAPEADIGSRTGRPDTSGYMLQADWTPFGQESSWGAPNVNLRLGVQYVGYSRFNGSHADYDGEGRNAKDNNTLSLFLWSAF
ncbi:hypothetical protein [Caulobacter sp.]|uniref:hypothetical protein n=1 Tax=Caulobacter sp. TaxID=78 RepID=UPI003BA9FFCE